MYVYSCVHGWHSDCEIKMIFTIENKTSDSLSIKFHIWRSGYRGDTLYFHPDTSKIVGLPVDGAYADSFHYEDPDDGTEDRCYFSYELDMLLDMSVYKRDTLIGRYNIRPNGYFSTNTVDCDTFPQETLYTHHDNLVLTPKLLGIDSNSLFIKSLAGKWNKVSERHDFDTSYYKIPSDSVYSWLQLYRDSLVIDSHGNYSRFQYAVTDCSHFAYHALEYGYLEVQDDSAFDLITERMSLTITESWVDLTFKKPFHEPSAPTRLYCKLKGDTILSKGRDSTVQAEPFWYMNSD